MHISCEFRRNIFRYFVHNRKHRRMGLTHPTVFCHLLISLRRRCRSSPECNTTGVPLSPLPLVRSQSEPIRSVSWRGVVPSDLPCCRPRLALVLVADAHPRRRTCSASPLRLGEVIVGEVLELQLVRRADKALGVAGGDDGVSELPDLADGVFERTIAVDHGLDVLAAGLAAVSRPVPRHTAMQSRGKSLTVSSVALLEPSSPYSAL